MQGEQGYLAIALFMRECFGQKEGISTLVSVAFLLCLAYIPISSYITPNKCKLSVYMYL